MAGKKNNRDNFPPSIIRTLRERVNGLCSNPDCRRVTLGPQESSKNKSVIIGQAAHISAASPGGPRYDGKMTEDERKSIENGIWLCDNCARKIDRDADTYSVSLLKSWKIASERFAVQQLDKPIAGHNIALDGLALITGHDIYDKDNLISHVHRVYEDKLMALDPRFDVRVDYVGREQVVVLNKADGMPTPEISCTVQDENEANKIKEFFLYGGEATITHHSLSVSGSPLLNIGGGGSLKSLYVSQEGINIVCDIDVFDENTKDIKFSLKSEGKLYKGAAGVSIQVNAMSNVLNIAWSLDLRASSLEGKIVKAKGQSISMNFIEWNGYKIKNLEDIDVLLEFCRIYSREHPIRFVIKSKEADSISLNGKMCINDNKDIIVSLEYLKMAKHILSFTGDDILFDALHTFTDSQYSELRNVYNILQGDFVIRKFVNGKPVGNGKILICENNKVSLQKAFDNKEYTSVEFYDDINQKMMIYNAEVILPKQIRVLKNVFLKTSHDTEEISIGDVVDVEFWPSESFSYEVKFEKKKESKVKK